jgi:hypothetical protein
MASTSKPQWALPAAPHPVEAIHYWEQWLQQADDYFERQQWQLAACWFGSCMDAAASLLALQFKEPAPLAIAAIPASKPSAADRYMIAGHSLCEALRRNGQPQLQLHFLLTIHLRLLQLANSKHHQYWLLKDNLEISLAMLSRYRRQHGLFKGYLDCYLETRLRIEQCSRCTAAHHHSNASLPL